MYQIIKGYSNIIKDIEKCVQFTPNHVFIVRTNDEYLYKLNRSDADCYAWYSLNNSTNWWAGYYTTIGNAIQYILTEHPDHQVFEFDSLSEFCAWFMKEEHYKSIRRPDERNDDF